MLYVCDFFLCIYIIVFLFLFDCMDNIVGDRMILLYFLNNLLIWMIFERKIKVKDK